MPKCELSFEPRQDPTTGKANYNTRRVDWADHADALLIGPVLEAEFDKLRAYLHEHSQWMVAETTTDCAIRTIKELYVLRDNLQAQVAALTKELDYFQWHTFNAVVTVGYNRSEGDAALKAEKE